MMADATKPKRGPVTMEGIRNAILERYAEEKLDLMVMRDSNDPTVVRLRFETSAVFSKSLAPPAESYDEMAARVARSRPAHPLPCVYCEGTGWTLLSLRGVCGARSECPDGCPKTTENDPERRAG